MDQPNEEARVRNTTLDEVIALIQAKVDRNDRFTNGRDLIAELEALKS